MATQVNSTDSNSSLQLSKVENTSTSGADANNNQNAELVAALAQMQEVISLLQLEIAKTSVEKTDLDQQMSASQVDGLNKTLQQLQQEEEMKAEKAEKKHFIEAGVATFFGSL